MRSAFAFSLVCEDSEKWVKWPISMRSVTHSQENKTMTFIRDIAVKQKDHVYSLTHNVSEDDGDDVPGELAVEHRSC